MNNIPLAKARAFADRVVHELAPYCARIEIAGSIRRQRPFVNDIDLVVIPKDEPGLRARCRKSGSILTDGSLNFIIETVAGVQVDIFFAHSGIPDLFSGTPSNWGTLLLCRTGSKEHNIWFAQEAHRHRLQWSPYVGLLDDSGAVVSSADESDLFKTLEIPWIPPESREK